MKYYNQPHSEIMKMRIGQFFAYLEQIEKIENPEKAKKTKEISIDEFKNMIGGAR